MRSNFIFKVQQPLGPLQIGLVQGGLREVQEDLLPRQALGRQLSSAARRAGDSDYTPLCFFFVRALYVKCIF